MLLTDDCPQQGRLRQLMLGDLTDAEAEPLERHLETCPACAGRLDRPLAVDADLSAWDGSSPALTGPERPFVDRLIEKLHREGPPPRGATAALTSVCGTDQLETSCARPGEAPAESEPRVSFDFLSPALGPGELGRLGSYRVLRVLGQGGMAVVFLADDLRLNRAVALKVILDNRYAEPQYRARFEQEAQALARLRHPNIVQIHEVENHRERPYLVLEYVEGGNLAEALSRRSSSVAAREAAALVATLATAMHYAHERGVVHRDLKPANILVRLADATSRRENPLPSALLKSESSYLQTATPMISDFGLAKQLGEEGLTQTGDLLGTPSYMAPELTRGLTKDTGRAVDVYSLGAILYELLTGRPPFRGESILETLEQVRTLDPVPPSRLQPGLPRDLQTVCLKCLEKEPGRRYASARELADDLGRFLRGEPVSARPVSPRVRLAKWVRRKPALAALMIVSGASVVTLLAVALVHNARLSTAVDRAETGEARAKEQQLRADANYRKGSNTIQRMIARLNNQSVQELLARLENQGLSGVPRLKELEQQQLEDALAFYQEIKQGLDSPEPEVRLDVARACRQTAFLQTTLGRNGPAEANLRQAIGLAEGLQAEAPANAEYRAELAASCTLLGTLLRPDDARHPEAERWLLQALALRRELSAVEPTAARQHDLAETLRSLAQLFFTMSGHFNDSKVLLDEAGGIWEQLVRERPEEDMFRLALATTYSNLGHFYEWSKPSQPDDAEAVYRKAEPLLQALVQKKPGQIEWAASLASLYSRQGNILFQKSPELALARFTSALDTVQALLKQEPRYAPAQSLLLHAHGGRAYAYEALKRFKEAVPEWDRVVELEDLPGQKPFRRSERAVTLARSGDHLRAAAEAEELTAKGPVTNEVLYNSACAYSRAVAAVLQDEQLTAAERKVLAEKYSVKGVALLSRLRAAGFFANTGFIKKVNEDPDFEPLRRHAQCQKLLRQLEEGEDSNTHKK